MNTIERALSKQKQNEKNKEANASENSASKNEIFESNQSSPEVPEATPNAPTTTGNIEIDLFKMEEKGFVSTSAKRRLINEEYRAIKRKIIDNAFGPLSKSLNNSNIIMVTSSKPGEGKTFTAINLALSIALEQDKTVLLVDADVLRPNVMRTLELQNQQGLMEYLLGEKSDIAQVMCQTNVPNLRIIPAGKSHHLSTELLASEKMYDVVQLSLIHI